MLDRIPGCVWTGCLALWLSRFITGGRTRQGFQEVIWDESLEG